MNDIAIRADGLGKVYRIGHERPKPSGLIPRLRSTLSAPFSWLTSQMRPPLESETLWAVRDVTFDIPKGRAIGLIGRNGAGKSTLLKLLARITEPTTGHADVYGHIASLLEVGTGMHPELTGRENIYLNGCILGMKKEVIDDNFHAIVDFSGVSRFLDTPVKRYSSGMRVRLGFAIAAHLQPEILLIDEVLAVGDAEFQRRCLGKMKDVAGSGRTIVFVSHNMGAIRNLTSQCIYMKDGRIAAYDASDAIVDRYLNDSIDMNASDHELHALSYYRRKQESGAPVTYQAIHVGDDGESMPTFPIGSTIPITFQLESAEAFSDVVLTLTIKGESGETVTYNTSRDSHARIDLQVGVNRCVCNVEGLHLVPGRYFINCSVIRQIGQKGWDLISDYPAFHISNVGDHALQVELERPGVIHWPQCEWVTS